MRIRIVGHVRSNVIGYVCLVWLMTGTAVAATQLSANSVGTKQLRTHAVTGSKIASGAITSSKVAKGSLTGAQIASATLGTVPSATNAANAAHATDADQLGGAAASAFQRRVTGTCSDGIASIGADGTATCSVAAKDGVATLLATATAPNSASVEIDGPNGDTNETLILACGNANATVTVLNNANGTAIVGAMSDLDGTLATTNANLTSGASTPIPFTTHALSQLVIEVPAEVITANIDMRDAAGACTLDGTAEVAERA